MNYTGHYPFASENCSCGASIALSAPDLQIGELLKEWRESHTHDSESNAD